MKTNDPHAKNSTWSQARKDPGSFFLFFFFLNLENVRNPQANTFKEKNHIEKIKACVAVSAFIYPAPNKTGECSVERARVP